ncbi:MAG: hypothetical protein E5V33_32335 [Mesorhizobium sp.]|nr:MAG: hypothetical protein E5W45_08995 [Mesorhizobium sp.]TIW59870.1 MAG: hypothetical protein E5V56_10310 [Mesorhizobium sp.]TIX45683.1 MAG: hypothetical protein E5V33_32335 [Mesorhizobium sp.]
MGVVEVRELRMRDRRSIREAEDAFAVTIEPPLAFTVADARWCVHKERLDNREAYKNGAFRG